MRTETERRLTAKLKGFPAWVLDRYEAANQVSERDAVAYIVKRWTQLDPEAKEQGLTLQDFQGGGEIVQFRKGER